MSSTTNQTRRAARLEVSQSLQKRNIPVQRKKAPSEADTPTVAQKRLLKGPEPWGASLKRSIVPAINTIAEAPNKRDAFRLISQGALTLSQKKLNIYSPDILARPFTDDFHYLSYGPAGPAGAGGAGGGAGNRVSFKSWRASLNASTPSLVIETSNPASANSPSSSPKDWPPSLPLELVEFPFDRPTRISPVAGSGPFTSPVFRSTEPFTCSASIPSPTFRPFEPILAPISTDCDTETLPFAEMLVFTLTAASSLASPGPTFIFPPTPGPTFIFPPTPRPMVAFPLTSLAASFIFRHTFAKS